MLSSSRDRDYAGELFLSPQCPGQRLSHSRNTQSVESITDRNVTIAGQSGNPKAREPRLLAFWHVKESLSLSLSDTRTRTLVFTHTHVPARASLSSGKDSCRDLT